MRLKYACLTVILGALSVGSFSCGTGVGPIPADSHEALRRMISQTPREDVEAEDAALWLSGKLVAPQSLYDRLHEGLQELRDSYSSTIPQVNIRFRPRETPSVIYVRLTDWAASQYSAGAYHEWDSLNGLFRLTDIRPSYANHFWLRFEGRLHPRVLASFYERLRGVLAAEPEVFIGDCPNIYPWIADDGLTFLVREAWGDCQSGCIVNNYWYFKETVSGINLVGEWQHGQPVPDWWNEAKTAFLIYRF